MEFQFPRRAIADSRSVDLSSNNDRETRPREMDSSRSRRYYVRDDHIRGNLREMEPLDYCSRKFPGSSSLLRFLRA